MLLSLNHSFPASLLSIGSDQDVVLTQSSQSTLDPIQ